MAYRNYDNEPEESQFNMALAVLQRVDQLMNACAIFSQKKLLGRWFNTLLPLSRQIDYDFKEGGDEEKDNKNFKKELYKLEKEYNTYRNRDNLGGFKNFGRFYEKLGEYEKFIRKCLNKRKMLMIGKDESALF